jgi:hypothetical protein
VVGRPTEEKPGLRIGGRWRGGSVARWLGGSVARWLGGSVCGLEVDGAVARWLGGSVARWLGGSVARWLGGSMARWLDGAVARHSESDGYFSIATDPGTRRLVHASPSYFQGGFSGRYSSNSAFTFASYSPANVPAKNRSAASSMNRCQLGSSLLGLIG